MSVLTALIKGEDALSAVLGRIADRGDDVAQKLEQTGSAGSRAFEQFGQTATEASEAIGTASLSTDHWTDAVGNYDKAMMEALYTTEELVEAGFKTEDALTSAAESADKAAEEYGKTADGAKKAAEEQEEMGKKGADAAEAINQALVAAGIAVLVNEIATAVINMANEFSDAEVIIARATGATGESLDNLNASMMRLYAADDDSLAEVAGIVGELNTRLRIEGDELERVTSLFQDYTQSTGVDGVAAVRNVTQVMKNWGVDVRDTEGLLDRLTIAGQMSGASVDSLSNMVVMNKATLQQLGYGLDESIALLSMFEYEGLNASSVMMGFRSAVTEFANEGRDASVAMQEVIEQIAGMANESEATALSIDTFGSRAGAELAYAIRNGKFEIEEWIAAVGSADGTLSRTADAATSLEDKWSSASNRLNAAFMGVLEPAVSKISEGLAGIVQGAGEFLDENPAVAAALAALGVGLGVVVVGFAGYTAAVSIANAVTAAFGVTASTALWPITLIVGAIAAVVAGAVLLGNALRETDEEMECLTATSKDNLQAVRDLEDQYERAAASADTSADELARLSSELETAKAVYESSRMTIEEFTASIEKTISSHDALMESIKETEDGFGAEMRSAEGLAAKLAELEGKTALTAGEQMQMEAIVGKLNKQYPDLNIQLDEYGRLVNTSAEAVRELTKADAERRFTDKMGQNYANLLDDEIQLQYNLEKAASETSAAYERWAEAKEALDAGPGGNTAEGRRLRAAEQAAREEYWIYDNAQEDIRAAIADTNAALEEHKEFLDKTAEAAANAAEETVVAFVSADDAVTIAVESVIDRLKDLAEVYDEAYSSARDSLDGTFGLFDKVEEKAGLSSEAIITAWQKQQEFFEAYNDNLQTLNDLDLNADFLAKLSDGSVESAGQVAALTKELGSLNPEEAAKRIGEINEAFEGLEDTKSETAHTIAEIRTNFNDELTAMNVEMVGYVNDMDMEALARNAARSTIYGYISEIRAGAYEAGRATDAVARTVVAHLETGSRPHYASGTTSAARGVALVGEEGPELVRFDGGETVYSAAETSSILHDSSRPLDAAAPAGIGAGNNPYAEKRITIEINGSGALDVSGGLDEGAIMEIMYANVKPVLLDIIQKERFEEGDLSYGF